MLLYSAGLVLSVPVRPVQHRGTCKRSVCEWRCHTRESKKMSEAKEDSHQVTRRDLLVASGATFIAMGGSALGQTARPTESTPLYRVTIEQMIADWKSKPKEVARRMLAKYGLPHEATPMRLIWHQTGPWKRTEVVNEEIPHNYPKPHMDMLLQVIDYHVPPDKFDELAEYDGSVIAERTKGELAARCDREEANFLALNLAHDIVTESRSVKEARQFYAQAMQEMKPAEYLQGLRFGVPRTAQGDPDREVLARR
jgi:hypothetical protein